MALADHYGEADVLDTLSWVGMTMEARIAKLANLYLDRESDMRHAHRNYEGPTSGTVRYFVKSVYVPPRGQQGITVKGVLAAIPKQRAVRNERRKHPTWTWERGTKKERRNAVAASLYTIWCEPRWNRKGPKEKQDPNCVGITRLVGARVTLIVEGGGYRHQPRIYMKHHATGQTKIVVMEGDNVRGITGALQRIAPKAALRGMYDGAPIILNFEGEGFIVNGKLVPWRNVRRIYGKKKAHKMPGNPKRRKD
jgi:hypothetical protein